MNKSIKKIATTSFLSLTLIAGSITGFNTINTLSYNQAYKSDKELRADWIKKNSNIDSIIQGYNSYQYSKEQYQKDQYFFNEVFQKNFYYRGYKENFLPGYIENSDTSIIDYLHLYNRYKGQTDLIQKQKNINKEWVNGKVDFGKYSFLYKETYNNLYSNKNERIKSDSLYYFNFQNIFFNNSDDNINNFNSLFKHNGLSQFIPTNKQIQEHRDKMYIAHREKNDLKREQITIEDNKNFFVFLDKYKKNELTEKEKYDFFKTLSYINFTMNQKIKEQNQISHYDILYEKNTYFGSMIDAIKDNTKFYDNINDNIALEKGIYNQTDDLKGDF